MCQTRWCLTRAAFQRGTMQQCKETYPDNKASRLSWLLLQLKRCNFTVSHILYASHVQVRINKILLLLFSDISRSKNRPYYPFTSATKSFLNTQYSFVCLTAVGCINVNVRSLNGWIQHDTSRQRRVLPSKRFYSRPECFEGKLIMTLH